MTDKQNTEIQSTATEGAPATSATTVDATATEKKVHKPAYKKPEICAETLKKLKQYTLLRSGKICYQPTTNNPMPGKPVAEIKKGSHPLSPEFSILENVDMPAGLTAETLQSALKEWITLYLKDTLTSLMALTEQENLATPVKDICDALYNGLGIIPRGDIREYIQKLDEETRRQVRAKRIKLGPVLVFQPDLNKPAAVNLRAQLWALYNGATIIPAKEGDITKDACVIPDDGTVSMTITPSIANKDFYRAISYPVYGTRAIRIDMLDRVINAIYDSAENGKFMAQHQMAEWLGCPIDDLYAILSAMGHTKISDPADNVEQTKDEQVKTDKPEKLAEVTEETSEENTVKNDAHIEKKEPVAKPDLATFTLKRGRASSNTAKQNKPYKKSKKVKGSKTNTRNKTVKKMSSGPQKMKPEDSPFAILQQLKNK